MSRHRHRHRRDDGPTATPTVDYPALFEETLRRRIANTDDVTLAYSRATDASYKYGGPDGERHRIAVKHRDAADLGAPLVRPTRRTVTNDEHDDAPSVPAPPRLQGHVRHGHRR